MYDMVCVRVREREWVRVGECVIVRVGVCVCARTRVSARKKDRWQERERTFTIPPYTHLCVGVCRGGTVPSDPPQRHTTIHTVVVQQVTLGLCAWQ